MSEDDKAENLWSLFGACKRCWQAGREVFVLSMAASMCDDYVLMFRSSSILANQSAWLGRPASEQKVS